MKKTLFLMLGYPGAGKTTTAKLLSEIADATHIWADHERRKIFDHPAYSHSENVKLYDRLNRIAELDLKAGKSVVYDTNFNYYKDRQKLNQLARKYDAQTVIIWVSAPRELAKQRATKNSHTQENRVLGDMYESDFDRLSQNLEPPHHDEHFINIDGTQVSKDYIIEQLNHNQYSLGNA